MKSALLLVLAAVSAHASAPGLLTYQGRLKESGLPVTAARSVTINICDAATLGSCTPSPSSPQSVSVVNGLFRTTFTVPSSIALESGSWYLEISVGGQTFSPREALTAAPYAIYASSAATLLANPGSSYVAISTPVSFGAQDASGYSLVLSSGINATSGVFRAKAFFGDGSGLTGLPSSTDITKVFKTGDSMTGALNLVGAALNLSGPAGVINSVSSVTASAFFGDGSHLLNITASGAILKTGDTMTGQLTSLSTITILGAGFSVGGATLAVSGGKVGIGTASPAASLQIAYNSPTDTPLLISNGADTTLGINNSKSLTYAPLVNFTAANAVNFGGGVTTGVGPGEFFVINPGAANLSNLLDVQQNGTSRLLMTAAGNLGVGTTVPASKFHMSSGTFLVDGGSDNGAPTGAGNRFVYLPSVGAIRAGTAVSSEWDLPNIGVNSVAFGQNNKASGNQSVVAGGIGNIASGLYSVVPGGYLNIAGGAYSFAGGAQAAALAQGSFVWADSQFVSLTSNIKDQFLVRAQGGFDIQSSSFIFSNGVSTFVYVNNTGLAMATGSSITLSGANGVIVTQSSITAGTYYGDGSHLTGVGAAAAVQKAGDVMSGNLSIDNSTLTVNGPIFSTGAAGGTVFSGAGTRFMWVPSSAAVRAGAVTGAQWDAANIGPQSVAFGANGLASGGYDTVSGGINNTAGPSLGASVGGGSGNIASGVYSVVGGGGANSASSSYAVVPGGFNNTASGSTSFAAGFNANAVGNGSFVWADSTGGAFYAYLLDQFKIRAQGGFVVQTSSALFTNGVSTYVYIDSTGLAMQTGSSITLSGVNGVIVTQSSITAGTYYGDGSHLSNVVASGGVLKTGDAMSGNLSVNNSTLTVNGPIFSTGTSGGTAFSGAGTRFMWVPSSAAVRGGSVSGGQWDAANIGAHSVVFGEDNLATQDYSVVSGGKANSATNLYATVGGGTGNSATQGFATVAGGSGGQASGSNSAIGGGLSNTASGLGSTVPGGEVNTAAGSYSLAAGYKATANALGSFIWADSASGLGAPISNNVSDSFLVRAMGGFSVLSSSYNFTDGVSTFVYVNNTGLAMATGSSITVSGANGVIIGQSSITASAFFGDGSHLTGITSAANNVLKSGDTMTGNLFISASTLTVNGPILSTGSTGGISLSGGGTRFMWIPSSAAFRGGNVTGAQWDPANVGAHSAAFGEDNMASAGWSVISGGVANSISAAGAYGTVSGGAGNSVSANYATVAGGNGNSNSGFASSIGGGFSNSAVGVYSTVPGGTSNQANSNYTFAAGRGGQANAAGAFVWADSGGNGGGAVPISNFVQDSFLARAMGGFTVFSSSFNFGNGVSTFVYVNNTGLAMQTGSSITLSGAAGVIVTQSSITAGTFYGDGSHLTNISAAGSVQKAGDGMTGPLTMLGGSTITVMGNAFSVGGSSLTVVGGRVGIGPAAPAAALDVQASAGDFVAAVFRNSSGVIVATVTASGIFASTQVWSYTLYDPQGIEAGDNVTSIISNRLALATIAEVWCESDDVTAKINLHRFGSGSNILPTDLTCGNPGTATTTFTAGETDIALGAKIDHLTQSVTAGAAKKINVVIKYMQR